MLAKAKLPQDGVLTPKHVRVILIQIYTTYLCIRWYIYIYIYIYIESRYSATEHRASTRILHLTLFLASVLVSVYTKHLLFNMHGMNIKVIFHNLVFC